MKILCFGDSNTYGYDPRSYFGGQYPTEHRWVDILAQKLHCKAVNAGENGREIPRREGELLRFDLTPPMQRGEWVPNQKLIDNSTELTVKYKNLASHLNIGFFDAGEWGISMTFDGVHFTEEGHRAFAEGLYQSLTSKGE